MSKKRITLNQFNIIGKKINVDIKQFNGNTEIEHIIIKNFEIDDSFINILNSMKALRRIWFINCIFINQIQLQNITSLEIEHCKNVDIKNINHLDLINLRLENQSVKNLKEIENFKNIENLYLQEIDLNEKIDFDKLPKIKKVNFNGSKVENREQLIDFFKDKDIEISFTEKNLKIG